jgi:hypothetical protein
MPQSSDEDPIIEMILEKKTTRTSTFYKVYTINYRAGVFDVISADNGGTAIYKQVASREVLYRAIFIVSWFAFHWAICPSWTFACAASSFK